MPSNRKNKLRKLLDTLQPFDDGVDSTFASLDKEIADVSARLKETITAKTLEDVNSQFKKLRKLFEPLEGAFGELKSKLKERDQKLLDYWNTRLKDVSKEFEQISDMTTEEIREKGNEISEIKSLISELQGRKQTDYSPLIAKTESNLRSLIEKLNAVVEEGGKESIKSIKTLEGELKLLTESLNQVREKANRLGGSAHLQINVNSSVMSTRYTDINFLSDTAIRWVATNDTTYKRVNIRASLISGGSGGSGTPGGNDTEIQFNDSGSFGGASVLTWNKNTSVLALRGTLQFNGATSGNVQVIPASVAGDWVMTLPVNDGNANQVLTTDGNGITRWASVAATGGSGITRFASTISVSSTFGVDNAKDYVAFANVGIVMTLPDATANSNLYTVKNFSDSSVLVVSTEGIDDSPNALMPTKYESLSFMSNGSIYGVV